MEIWNKYKTLLEKSGINTPLRLAHFISQLDHESGLKPISENLNYSKEGLLKTFPKYFTANTVDRNKNLIIGTAQVYSKKPEKIANRVYANRMGNGDEASGDGWKYRGKGFLQITGKNNYKALSLATNIDYLNNPEMLLNESDSLIAALWFWNTNKLNTYADKDDILTITKKINGGTNGLDHRKQLLTKYKKIFKQ